MKKAFLVITLIVAGFEFSFAQRTYFEFKLSKEIFKDFELSVSPQVRFNEGFDLKKYFADLEAEYEFNKYFSASATYRLGTNITKKDNKEFFGRFAIDAKTGFKWHHFESQFRLRYSNENSDFSDDKEENANYLRYKIGLEYHIKKLDLTPYIYTEFFQNLPESNWDKTRYEGGLDYKINKHNKIGAYYRLNTTEDDRIHIIGLSYKLEL
ncbi:MAG: DUF2490 domain-containing protein [Draconibacterium sp.]